MSETAGPYRKPRKQHQEIIVDTIKRTAEVLAHLFTKDGHSRADQELALYHNKCKRYHYLWRYIPANTCDVQTHT